MRRNNFENYKAEYDKILIMMARYGIIKNRFEFYNFCREFMPYKFREKVIPMMLPGNIRNIPYNKELTFTPILENGNASLDDETGDNSQPGEDESSESDND